MNTKKKAGQTCTGTNSNPKVQKIPYRKSYAVRELEVMANDVVRLKNPNTSLIWFTSHNTSQFKLLGGATI